MLSSAFCRDLILVFVGVVSALGTTAAAQQQTTPALQTKPAPAHSAKDRPKIGLVFEGGGALGFAHIGVIEWMEEHHIPADYIAGTSMGGLVEDSMPQA